MAEQQITVNTTDYHRMVMKLARYEAALQLISTVGVGAYTTIDGWSSLTKIAQRTALRALKPD